MILRSSYFMFRRMLRSYVGMAILVLTPLALITVLGFIVDGAMSESQGIPMIDEVVVIMTLTFLMYGGFYTMEYVQGDLMTSMKWRMYSLPYEAHKHAYAILISSTLFNVLQSFVIVIYTIFVYDVHWGNMGLVLLILLVVSIVIQLIYINFVLGVKTYKTAERLGTGFGLLCLALGEVWFPLPEGTFFQFIASYSNPFSLGKNMIFATMTGEHIDKAFISLGILIAWAVGLSILAVYFGRRKL
ncbi:ABC transporter permease [Bacillus sp. PS06]|uniref:ABC transporter permease n=1 Tax=Bacillus sp. PS06 TaxID=2764176 RepID=UPI001785963E|nr:ABC transporter permease [Bacillus sp. PS06]MBD8069374.1 ABC transporter permease [Bacillus sp. PS06]